MDRDDDDDDNDDDDNGHQDTSTRMVTKRVVRPDLRDKLTVAHSDHLTLINVYNQYKA